MISPIIPTLEVKDTEHLFRLPPEIRYQIYSYLIPEEHALSPVRGVDIASATHRPPKPYLLSINKSIASDIFTYFVDQTTWSINVQYAFNFFRKDPDLDGLVSWSLLPHIRKVHLMVTIDRNLMLEYPNLTLDKYCKELSQRCDKVCKALTSAQHLDRISISFLDGSSRSASDQKARIFRGLQDLPEQTRLAITLLESIDIPASAAFSHTEDRPQNEAYQDDPMSRFLQFMDAHGYTGLETRRLCASV